MLIPITLRISKQIYLKLNPPPPPPPTTEYGKLPLLKFPQVEGVTPNTKPIYKLETITGGLPQLPGVGKVYVVGINKSRLLELERVKTRVRFLKFHDEPERLSENVFRFANSSPPTELIADMVSGKFSYKLDFVSDPANFLPVSLPTVDQAASELKGFLGSMQSLSEDLANGIVKGKYLIATESGEMVESPSYSEANMVRIDLFRADKDKMAFVNGGGKTSTVNALFSGVGDKLARIVSINFAYSQIVGEDFATYPLKSVDQAWSELTQGKAYISKNISSVTVRRVSLAYYESDDLQAFVQPVFVFEGDEDFFAYVQAVDPKYLEESK